MKRLGKFARIGAIVFAALGILTLLADRLFQRWLLHKALATAAPELIHSGEAAQYRDHRRCGRSDCDLYYIHPHTVVDAAGGHCRVVCGPRGSLSGGLAPAPQAE